tara:strand:- start:1330 stop:1467 length:138 start_codon:yes stop_codon:yes gene_type:complete
MYTELKESNLITDFLDRYETVNFNDNFQEIIKSEEVEIINQEIGE